MPEDTSSSTQPTPKPRRRPWKRTGDGGGPDPKPIRLIDLCLVAAGLSLLVTGIVLAPKSGPTAAPTKYPQVSVSAILEAADAGKIEQVALTNGTTPATAIAAQDITDGLIPTETGAAVKAGDSLNFYTGSDLSATLVNRLTADGVAVWMTSSAPTMGTPGVYQRFGTPPAGAAAVEAAPASATAAQPTPRPAGAPHPDQWKSTSMLVAGALLLALGAFRMLSYHNRRHKRREAAAAEAAQKAGGNVPSTRFSDVAGADEAVEQSRELVECLRHPEKFTEIGAKIPKGMLLVGPPGTGKTLLARAVAGEAGVNFFAAAGSDFVEKYVGVGAKRVRELFATARKSGGRAIIFIDEIDAVARKRSENGESSGGHVESENTLMALLAEMDGFVGNDIVVIAATNRADILDPALTRPGRLDRRVEVPLPDRRGREHILAVHAAKVKLGSDVDLAAVAKRTPGFSGAQLESVVNEAALEAVRREYGAVTSAAFDQAVATVAMGRARTSALVTENDRLITCWHEAGHTVTALLLKDAMPPVQVSAVPRGPAGGVTWMAETDDQFMSRAKAHARLVVALGGRAAEQMLLGGEFTQGAAGDLQQATETALLMTTRYGMTRLGLASRAQHLGGTTTREVTEVVEELLAEAHAEAAALLNAHEDLVRAIAEELLDKEDLDAADLLRIARAHGVEPASMPTPLPEVPSPREEIAKTRRVPETRPETRPDEPPATPPVIVTTSSRPTARRKGRLRAVGAAAKAAYAAARGKQTAAG